MAARIVSTSTVARSTPIIAFGTQDQCDRSFPNLQQYEVYIINHSFPIRHVGNWGNWCQVHYTSSNPSTCKSMSFLITFNRPARAAFSGRGLEMPPPASYQAQCTGTNSSGKLFTGRSLAYIIQVKTLLADGTVCRRAIHCSNNNSTNIIPTANQWKLVPGALYLSKLPKLRIPRRRKKLPLNIRNSFTSNWLNAPVTNSVNKK